MALSAELEARTRRLAAATGWVRSEGNVRMMLRRMPDIPDILGDAIDEFWIARNKIVHGHAATDPDEALRAIDAGITIIRTLDGIGPAPSMVTEPHVTLYEDADGRTARQDAHGVVLGTPVFDEETPLPQVVPTTHNHFVRGMEVAWEWGSTVWGRTWYRDPGTGEMRKAWDESAEFIGRDLQSV